MFGTTVLAHRESAQEATPGLPPDGIQPDRTGSNGIGLASNWIELAINWIELAANWPALTVNRPSNGFGWIEFYISGQ